MANKYDSLFGEPEEKSTKPKKEERNKYDDLFGESDSPNPRGRSAFLESLPTEEDYRSAIGMMGGIGAGGLVFKGLEKPLLAAGMKWLPRAITKSAVSGGAGTATEAAIKGEDPVRAGAVGTTIGGAIPVAGAVVRKTLPPITKVAGSVLNTGMGKALDLLGPEGKAQALHGMEKSYAAWHELVSSGEQAVTKLVGPGLADTFKQLRMEWSINAGQKVDEYVQAVKGLDKMERYAASALVEGRLRPQDLDGLVNPNKIVEVENAAQTMRNILDDIRNRATELQLPMKGPGGELYEFSGLDDYFPRKIVNTKEYLPGGAYHKDAVKAVMRSNVQRRDAALNEIEALRVKRTEVGERIAKSKQAENVGRHQVAALRKAMNTATKQYEPDAAAARVASLRQQQKDVMAAVKSTRITPNAAFKERRAIERAIRVQENVVKRNQITTKEQAEEWLKDLHERSIFDRDNPFDPAKKSISGSSHLRGRAMGLPGYEMDPDMVIPQYIEHMERRLALTDAFGPQLKDPETGAALALPETAEGFSLENVYPRAYEQVMQMPDGPIKSSAKVVIDRLLGQGYQPSGAFKKLEGAANVGMNLQTISRLTFSALNQPSQISMAGAAGGWRGLVNNTIKTMFRDPDVAEVSRRSAATLQGLVRHANMELMGMTRGATAKAAQGRLSSVGMPQMDLGARAVGAMQGQTVATYQARQLMEAQKALSGPLNAAKREFYERRMAKISDKLNQLNISPGEVIQQNGQLTDDQLLRAANSLAFDTNFWSDALSLPGFFASPEARVLLQFKSFMAQNTILIKNRFVKPAMKWVATGGKEGEVAPLLSLVAAQGLYGEAVSDVKSFLMNKERPKDVKERLVENLAQGGLLGPFADAMYAVNHGYEGVIAALAGPSVTTAAKGIHATADLAKGKPKAMGRFLVGDVAPLAGPLPALVAPAVKSAEFPSKTRPPRLKDVPFNPFAAPDTTGSF